MDTLFFFVCKISFLLVLSKRWIRREYYEPIPVNTENEMTVVKFRISSYFAQITSIVNIFRKYHSKVLKRFIFFEIEESLKIAILAASRRREWPKIVHFREFTLA